MRLPSLQLVTAAHNFQPGVDRILHWVTSQLAPACALDNVPWSWLVHDDHSDRIPFTYFNELAQLDPYHITVTHATPDERASLKVPYHRAAQLAIENGHDAVLVIESDVYPTMDALACLAAVYADPFRKPLASVSPMYSWKSGVAYPTHDHWFSDGLELGAAGRKQYDGVGVVANIGGNAGAPFGFSLWSPRALACVLQPEFPRLYGLDGAVGKYLSEQGFSFLRCVDVYVDHHEGGARSTIETTSADSGAQCFICLKNHRTSEHPETNRRAFWDPPAADYRPKCDKCDTGAGDLVVAANGVNVFCRECMAREAATTDVIT